MHEALCCKPPGNRSEKPTFLAAKRCASSKVIVTN